MRNLIALIWLLFAGSVFATDPIRLMHPAYRANQNTFGARNPWSKDGKRIMMYENTGSYTTSYGTKTGRGLVWGWVADCSTNNCLTAWTSLAQYESYATPLPDQIHMSHNPFSAYWSPFAGEESIIYAPFYSGSSCSYLKKIDVAATTPTWTNVIAIDGTGGSCDVACYGYDDSNRLACSRKNEDWSAGGYYITLTGTPSLTEISSWPTSWYANYTCMPPSPYITAEGWTFPDYSEHGHGGKNPGRTWWANNYGDGTYTGVINTKGVIKRTNSVCQVVPDTLAQSNHSTHVSWKASDTWFITGTCGDVCDYQTAPTLDTFRVYKGTFDGGTFSYTELLNKVSAGRWQTTPGAADHVNYESEPIPTLKPDGMQLVFNSTDGHYTYEDYVANPTVATTFGLEGVFLYNLAATSAPPTVTITTPTTAPAYVSNTTPLTIAGTTSDDVAVTSVTWVSDRGVSGTATGTTSWSMSVALQTGDNVITVTAHDGDNQTGTDVITVTNPVPSTPTITITGPTSDPTYSTSTAPLATLAGTATATAGVDHVSWTNNRGWSGTATGTTSWSISCADMEYGENVFVITVYDVNGLTASDAITVTLLGSQGVTTGGSRRRVRR